jgi:hypothetical protein
MNIIETIETVVQNIRKTAVITGITDNADDTYTVTTANTYDLSNNDYITIASTTGFNGSNYKISNVVTNTSFDISKTKGTAIPGSFGTWTANAPYFMKGRWTEITKDLIDKADSSTYMNQRFPLIVLIIPIEFTEDKKRDEGLIDVSGLEIYYFVESDDTKTTDEKYTATYSTLESMSETFNTEFKRVVLGDMFASSEWNPVMDGRAYVFSSPVDAWIDRYEELKLQDVCN